MLLGLIALTTLLAGGADQRNFATPDDAVKALIQASEHDDTVALLKIFGPEGKAIVESGDTVQDRADREDFVRLARERMEVIHDPGNGDQVVFTIGNDDWPFPVPLVRQNGKWEFDSGKGRLELLAHRIGENESDTVDTCRAFIEAELDYASSSHDGTRVLQYARKTEGLRVPPSFVSALVGENPAPKPYHGYLFRVLMEQGANSTGGAIPYIVDGKMIGGVALIAWPAEYGTSGIQTFIINHQGLVYARDLGPDTAKLAGAITVFDPDKSWQPLDKY
jgi:hypothetical protein